ncbi:hypothetical protein DM01DRAFT_1331814 [Hesseltinella vesiculosa]|uniref:Endoplasmic reticulum junction formation protein lunapark n=1 Tax=Hesseltinella vesiculosa TaxID=101127 RepID=A0A1X2GWG8_9FUNG|nr:hypothetical protein DM01DRAFT_1331814 [Hesseltinella vesiculosa]
MGGLLSKERTDPNDYEKVLSELDANIQKAELRLTEIKLRQRRTGLLWVIYATLAWLVYVAYWFFTIQDGSWNANAIQAAPVLLIPVGIYYMRKGLAWFYTKKQSSEESHLATLRAQQKLKVEELKKKTSYYTTQSLLERYDAEAMARKKQQQQMIAQQQQKQQDLRQRKPGNQGMARPPSGLPQQPQQPGMTTSPMQPNGQQLQQQVTMAHHPPVLPAPRGPPQWYDKLIDALVGEDGPETKYALICQYCYMHNGLILPSEVETIQYSCPHCKKFNPSRKSRQLHPDGPVLPIDDKAKPDALPQDTTVPTSHDDPAPLDPDHPEEELDADSIASRVRHRRKHSVDHTDEPVNNDHPAHDDESTE